MLFDDTDVTFTGRWAYHIDPLIPNTFHSFHATNHSGDFAAFNFSGIAVKIFGLTGSTSGFYNVSIDGVTSSHDGGSGDPRHQSLLFSQENLDPITPHSLVVTNNEEGHLLTIDLVNVTTSASPPPSHTSHGLARGSLIAVIVAASICGIILLSFAFFMFRRRRIQQRKRLDQAAKHPRLGSIHFDSFNSPLTSPFSWMNPRNENNLHGAATPVQGLRPNAPAVANMSSSPSTPPSPTATRTVVAGTSRAGVRSRSLSINAGLEPPRRRTDTAPSLSGSLKSAENIVFFGSRVDNRATRAATPTRDAELEAQQRRSADAVFHRSTVVTSTSTYGSSAPEPG